MKMTQTEQFHSCDYFTMMRRLAIWSAQDLFHSEACHLIICVIGMDITLDDVKIDFVLLVVEFSCHYSGAERFQSDESTRCCQK
jgi:hypothetical protein